MNDSFVKFIRISFATIALVMLAAATNSVQAQNEDGLKEFSQSANRIVGAWETTVTPRNCETGEQIGPAFSGVITYNEGGTVAEYGANPATPFRTPGHGIWASRGGHRRYEMRFSFLPLTPAGAPIGRLRVSQEMELGRFSDEMSSSGSFTLTNLSGVLIGSGCTTSVAVRLEF